MQSILKAIGHTPMVQLERIPHRGGAAVFVKLEYFNPTASYKDRMAISVIERAEQRGELRPGMTVVENTAGSTGTALAFVCAVKSYKFKAISSNAFSREKLKAMELFGAELELIHNGDRGITPDLVPRMLARARELSQIEGNYWARQFENPDVLAGYTSMATEILQALDRPLHTFCAAVGTSGMFTGVTTELKKLDPTICLIALEPAAAPILSKGQTGAHKIEGIAPGFVPPFIHQAPYDEIHTIEEQEARQMARRLVQEEGIFAGTSTGLNVAAAVRIAASLSPEDIVVTVAVDSGLKYLSTDLYA